MTTEVAEAPKLKKVNGREPHLTDDDLKGDIPVPLLARRPYIMESDSFIKQMEVSLLYADNELALVRANLAALRTREMDLIRIRQGALSAIEQATKPEPENE